MQVKRIYHKVLKDGGITLTSRLIQVKKSRGFFVSLDKIGNSILFSDFSPDTLDMALDILNPFLLKNVFVGIWLDKLNDKVYIDISEWIGSRNEAIQKGILENQTAIWDIEKDQEIYLK